MKAISILALVITFTVITGCSKKSEFSDIFRCAVAADTLGKYKEANTATNYLAQFTKGHMPNLTNYEVMQLTSDVRNEFDHMGGVSLDTAIQRLYKAYNSSYCKKIYSKK